MFRRIALGSVLVASVGLAPTVAVATPGASPAAAITIHRGLPSGWTFADYPVGCFMTTAVAGATYRHIPGPGPGGDGALEMTVPAGGSAVLTIPLSGTTMSSLDNFTVETEEPPASAGPAMSSYVNVLGDINDAPGSYDRIFRTLSPGSDEFVGDNVLVDAMQWTKGTDPLHEAFFGSGTYAQFLANTNNTMHPATPRSVEYRLDNCSGTVAQSIDLDDLVVGIDGTETLYSLDAPLPPTLTPNPVLGIVAGKKVSPSVKVTDGTDPLEGLQLDLLKKTAGAKKFTAAGTATTNSKGIATASAQQPTKNTTYEWYFPAALDYAQALSTPSVVKVSPKVSIFLAKRIVKHGKPLQISGTVAPKQGGTKIILWRKKGAKLVKLAKTTEKGNGFFTFSKVLPKGNYLLIVTSKKTATNAAGTSATKAFSVTK